MSDRYGLAAFRSRTQVLRLEARLRQMGIPASTVTTPRAVSMGCGLSVRFPAEHIQSVRAALRAEGQENLIGLYRAEHDGARLRLERF